jgi:uncharacterized protein YgiM (DUF1202 family)
MKTQLIINALSIAMLTGLFPNIAPASAQSGPGSYGNVTAAYSCSRDGDSVNLRARAGQQAKVLRKIPAGKQVVLVGTSKVVDEFTWQKVNFYGVTGWVRGDFLCN